VNELFRKFAQKTSAVVGSPWAFIIAALIILTWAITGPLSASRHVAAGDQHRDDHCHVLDVFLIQNTQNRDARAIHLKLDEIISSLETARNSMLIVEDLPDEKLAELQSEFNALHDEDARKQAAGTIASRRCSPTTTERRGVTPSRALAVDPRCRGARQVASARAARAGRQAIQKRLAVTLGDHAVVEQRHHAAIALRADQPSKPLAEA